jgi:hypothetical protein
MGPGSRAAWLSALGVSMIWTAAARAELGVRVDPPAVAPATSTLVATFRVTGVVDEADSTVGEGIPATLVLAVDLWRDRSGWWDALVHTEVYTYRFRRDVWWGTYEVVKPDGTLILLPDRTELRVYLERVYEVPLGPASAFDADKGYYLSVKATLKPLDADDLAKVDAWVSGDVTKGRGGGGLLGVPRAVANIAVDLSGLGDRSAEGRSERFIPNPAR